MVIFAPVTIGSSPSPMLDDSFSDLEFEDDNSLLSDGGFVYDESDIESLADSGRAADALETPTALIDEKFRQMKSTNTLSSFIFRPLSLSWYIYEHFLLPARELQKDFLPTFDEEELLLLLHVKRWLVNEVTSDYFGDWPRLREASGLTDTRNEVHLVETLPDMMCAICCEEGTLDVFSLLCGHKYCTLCYKRYILMNLPKGVPIRCMNTLCNLALLYRDVKALLQREPPRELASDIKAIEPLRRYSTAELEDEYDNQFDYMDSPHGIADCADPLASNPLLISAARLAIDLNPKLKWCPSVDCTNLVELFGEIPQDAIISKEQDISKVAVVTCTRSHEFCFNCQFENHLPCPCWIASSWIKRCEDDSETVNWIDANTQACPKCQAVIEKNGGCNHMVCGKCKNEFCWICLGEWNLHKSSYWRCNRFNPKEVEEVKKKQTHKHNSLSRYLHFHKRFSVHQVSMDGDKKTLHMVHRCMLQYMKAQALSNEKLISWNDVQFLSDAIRSLSTGRKTLMWTYAFAFYLKKTNLSEIFEGMQDYLNKTVEDLLKLFEEIKVADSPVKTAMKITSKKAEIVNLASLVTRRRELLIESAYNGIQLGMLQFFSP